MSTDPVKISAAQHIQEIIASCDAFLSYTQAEIKKAINDNRVTEWADVNFHHNAATLAACGTSPTLQKARDHFRKELPNLIDNLRHLDNDLGNLKADIKVGSVSTATTLPTAQRLNAKLQTLKKQADAILQDCNLLRESHTVLYGSLNLETILPFAKDKSSKDGPIFDIGYKLYLLTSDNPPQDNNEKSLDDFFSETTKQETLLTNIKLAGIPKLATSTIKEQIKDALKATTMVKDGIDLLRETFTIEHNHIKNTEKRIAQLKSEDILRLLSRIDEEADALLNDILRFHHKMHHMNKIYDLQETILLLQFLQRTIKKDLQTKLKEEIIDSDSPLNPSIAAAKAAQKFLEGPKGFWRGSKIVIRLIMQKPTVNLISFEKTLRKALNTCPTLSAIIDDDGISLENFINEELIVYDSPFPRKDLHKIMKKCILDYGLALEKFCRSFKVDISSITDKSGTITIKKLIKKILANSAKLLK